MAVRMKKAFSSFQHACLSHDSHTNRMAMTNVGKRFTLALPHMLPSSLSLLKVVSGANQRMIKSSTNVWIFRRRTNHPSLFLKFKLKNNACFASASRLFVCSAVNDILQVEPSGKFCRFEMGHKKRAIFHRLQVFENQKYLACISTMTSTVQSLILVLLYCQYQCIQHTDTLSASEILQTLNEPVIVCCCYFPCVVFLF